MSLKFVASFKSANKSRTEQSDSLAKGIKYFLVSFKNTFLSKSVMKNSKYSFSIMFLTPHKERNKIAASYKYLSTCLHCIRTIIKKKHYVGRNDYHYQPKDQDKPLLLGAPLSFACLCLSINVFCPRSKGPRYCSEWL